MSGLIKVFISHQTTNDKAVDLIYDALEKNNIKCWADHRDEPIMHDWAGEIPPAIKESNLFIFLFSYESNNSDQCMREINYAINYCHIPVFVIKLDNLDFNDSFAYNFSKDNYLMAFDGIENHISEITQSVIEFRNDPERIRKNNIIFNTKTFKFATKQYYIDKKYIDPSFDEGNIVDYLLPTVSNNENKYNYKKLLNIIKSQNIALIGQQGGSGKTTLLTKIFTHYLEAKELIPIYVNMKTLSAKDFIIERYIDMTLFGNITAMKNSSIGDSINMINRELSKNSEKPTYLLLLDGFDEVPNENKDSVLNSMKIWISWSNVKIVLASRSIDLDLIGSNIHRFNVDKLSDHIVQTYIDNNSKKYDSNLAGLLSLPMYLDIYTKADDTDDLKTKGDLLNKYIDWQNNKDNESKKIEQRYSVSNIEEIKTQKKYCLNYILPAVAFYMVTKKNNVLSIKYEDCEDILDDILADESSYLNENTLSNDNYFNEYEKNNYSIEYLLSFFNCQNRMSKKIRNNNILKTYLSNSGLFRISNENEFEFIHKDYRDFFCALFITKEIGFYSFDSSYTPVTLGKQLLPEEIIAFVSDLLKEGDNAPVCDNMNKRWNFICNEKSKTYKCFDCFRENTDAVSTANLVNILKYARRTDLSNCDFSNLDLTKCYFNNCILYRFYDDKKFSSTFEGSKINKENIIAEVYSGNLTDACLYNDILATCDNASHIRLWDIQSKQHIPFKLFKSELYPIKKILFMNSKSIIAMTDYDIAKINIESKETSVLYTSESLLNEIFIEENGDISFTTVTNPLNKKIIGNIQADTIKFSPFATISAINKQQNLIAFKNVSNDGCLSLYSPNNGYILFGQYLALYKILRPYAGYIPIKIPMSRFRTAVGIDAENDSVIISKIERIISFISKNSDITVKIKYNGNVISFIITDNSKKESFFEDCPGLVLSKSAHDELKNTIPPDCLAELFNELKLIISNENIYRNSYKWMVKKFLDKLKNSDFDVSDTSNLRFHSIYGKIFGNKVEDLIVKNIFDDSKINNIHPNSIKFVDDYKLLLSEDDTILIYDIKNNQLETVFSINTGKFQYVDYMNGRIVAIYGNTVCVLNNEYNIIFRASQSTTKISRLAKLYENIFVSSGCILYEFDSNLTCKRSIKIPFGFSEPVIAQSWRDNKYYVVYTKRPIAINSGHIGFENTDTNDYYNPTELDYRILDEISFKRNQNTLVSIDTKINKIIAKNEIQNGLVLVGCNFKNICGTLSDNENLKILECYGAIV